MKTRNIIISVLAAAVVSLLCLVILLYPMNRLREQQEESIGTVTPASVSGMAAGLSEKARSHPLALSLYQHKQHALISEGDENFEEIGRAQYYPLFRESLFALCNASGLHLWDGALPDDSTTAFLGGSVNGYEVYYMENGSQALNFCVDSGTGQPVNVAYATTTDLIDFDPSVSDGSVEATGNYQDIRDFPDIADRIMDSYIRVLDFSLSDFQEVSSTGTLDYYDSQNHPSFLSRSMRYSQEYQVYLSTALLVLPDKYTVEFSLCAVSLTPEELALALGNPLTDGQAQQTAPAPATYEEFHTEHLTALNEAFATNKGIYIQKSQAYDYNVLLTYYDRETATSRVLCDLPDCRHDTDECPAKCSTPYTQQVIFADGQYLYEVSLPYEPESGARTLSISRSNLDGSGKKPYYSSDLMDVMGLYPSTVDFFWDGKELYLLWKDFTKLQYRSFEKMTPCLYRLNLDTLETVLFCGEEKLLYLFEDILDDCFLVRVADNLKDHSYQLFDTELNPVSDRLETTGYHHRAILQDSVYLLTNKSDTNDEFSPTMPPLMTVYQVKDGKFTLIHEEQYPLEADYTDLAKYADLMIINQPDSGIQHSYIVDPDDYSLSKISLTCWIDRYESCIHPILRCGDDYLVETNTAVYSSFSVRSCGEIIDSAIPIQQFAFISVEDYLANRPNYRIVQNIQ